MAKKGSKRFAQNQSKSTKKNKKTRKPNIVNSIVSNSTDPKAINPDEILSTSVLQSNIENQDIEIFGNNIGKNLKSETVKFSIITSTLIGVLIILSFIL